MKRIGIVGCGTIAKTHGLAIQDLGYECVAVTSRHLESVATFAQKYAELRADWLTVPEWMTDAGRAKLRAMFPPPQVYPDLSTMMKAGPLDAVIIATWPPSHCELTCEAAVLGAKAVLCEKPMALSVAECQRMIDVCREHGTRLAVYHDDVALLPQLIEARRIIASGQIGEVDFIRANTVCSQMDWSNYLWAGILYLLPGRTITLIDAALDCTKRAVSFGHAQEDRATVHFTMDDGLHGVVFTGQGGFTRHGIRVDGREGALEISFISAPTLRVWRQGTTGWEVVAAPRACYYDDRRAFLAGIVTGDPNFNQFDGVSALRSTVPVFAAWQSHVERRPSNLSEPVTFTIPATH